MSTATTSSVAAPTALPRVMVVDDDRDFADSLASFLQLHGCNVEIANSDTAAEKVSEEFGPDVALVDLRLGRASGLDVVAKLVDNNPELLCVIVTAYAEIDIAIQAIRRGAYDFLRKPLRNDEVLVVLNRCMEHQQLRREQQHLEVQLQAGEERFRATFEHAPVGIALVDADGRLERVNPKFSDIFGYRAGDLARMTLPDLYHPDYAGDRSPDERLPDGSEVQFRRKDGEAIWGAVTVSPIPKISGESARNITVVEDLTQRVRAEQAVRQKQKMDAVCELTGGVAHEFNNLLAIVLGNLEMMGREVSGDVAMRRYLDHATSGAQRGVEIVQQLLAIAGAQSLHPRVVDVNTLVLGMVEKIGQTLGEQVTIDTSCALDLWLVLTDSIQLENAVLNLAINGRDAMPTGGRLTITTANLPSGNEAAARLDLPPGDYVCLSVSDTGTGMSPEVAARAFEPFFTTKDVTKSGGLGLGVVYGFATQSGGNVKIETSVGNGTTVSLALPRLRLEAPAETKSDAADAIPRGAETILMVEDDKDVRALLAAFLTSFGYRVIAAEDGPSALRLFEKSPNFDLLVTDMLMSGGMNGRELAKELRRKNAGVRVLFVSGHADNEALGDTLGSNEWLLAKPIRRATLAQAVRQALDS